MKMFLMSLLIVLLLAAGAHAQAPFYQGKTITIVVGTKAGDAYDLSPGCWRSSCQSIFRAIPILSSKTCRARRR